MKSTRMAKERMLRDPEKSFEVKERFGITNRRPRNREYAGPHSNTYTKKALELAKQYHQKVPCGPNHFVYPSGRIVRRRKVKK